MAEFEQSEVSKTVWPWTAPKEERPVAGMNPKLKVAISTPIAYLIAYGIYRWRGHAAMPLVVVGIATTIAFCGLFIPPAFEAIERFFLRFAAWVATALTWILLTPMFFLVFAPMHLMLVIRRKDPMHRACPTDAPSYWNEHPPVTRESYYRSQH